MRIRTYLRYGFNAMLTAMLLTSLSFLPGTKVTADELDPARIPADAKWVIHIDVDALRDSEIAEYIRDEKSQMVNTARQCIQREFGIDLREDLNSITLFSDTYDSHTGAAIVSADFNEDQIISKFKECGDVKMLEGADQTMLTLTIDPSKFGGHKAMKKSGGLEMDDRKQNDSGDGNTKDAAKSKIGENKGTVGRTNALKTDPSSNAINPQDNQDPNRKNMQSAKDSTSHSMPKTLTIALLNNKHIVVAPNPDRCKTVVSMLSGNEQSLAADSPLIENVSEGAFVYGAAINLEQIKRNDQVFPILSQHKRIVWTCGQRNGNMYEDVVLEGTSSEVAEKMKQIMEGYTALFSLWAGESKALVKMANGVEVTQEGSTVKAHWEADAETTVNAIDDVMNRINGNYDMNKAYTSDAQRAFDNSDDN
jgi:hypothetical protein